jgi:hypothetical protein
VFVEVWPDIAVICLGKATFDCIKDDLEVGV